MHGPYPLGGTRWWLRDGERIEALGPEIERLLEDLAQGRLVDRKKGRRKALFDLQLGAPDPSDYLLKQNLHRGSDRLRRRLMGSKSRLELERAERLAARGLATPVPVAAGERTRRGLLDTCWLLMPLVPDAIDLRAWWEGPPPSPRERRWLAQALGALARSAVDSGLFQDDFAPNNVLLRRGVESELLMIDFERARVLERLSEGQIRRMLGKLDREMRGATRADRMRFLVSFAGDRARTWWRLLATEAPQLMARDLAHLERSLAGGARRYVRFEDADHRGWHRADQPRPSEGRPASGMTSRLPPVDEREARRILAKAILLFRRGLGPSPHALVTTPDACTILWDLPPCPAATPSARRVLVHRLEGLGRIEGEAEADAVGQTGPLGVERGLWLAPQRFTVAAGPRRGLGA